MFFSGTGPVAPSKRYCIALISIAKSSSISLELLERPPRQLDLNVDTSRDCLRNRRRADIMWMKRECIRFFGTNANVGVTIIVRQISCTTSSIVVEIDLMKRVTA